VLAEAGADVIKVERPGTGDEMRGYTPRFGADSVNHVLLNRGKRSIALDLKSPGAMDVLGPLLDEADVIVEQFRPGVMDRLGLGYEAVRARNEGIIYCSITGYGQMGPKALVAAHDLNYISTTGLLSLAADESGAPVLPPALIADIGAGTYPAVVNILLALRARDRSGEGTHLDIAMGDHLFGFMHWSLGNGFAEGQWPVPGGELVTGGSPRYHIYRTSDGRYLAAAPLEQRFWDVFCELIELPEALRDDAPDARATTRAVAEIIASRSAEEWQARFEGNDCCCCIVATVEEAVADPHPRARGLFDYEVQAEDGRCLPALPVPVAPQFRRPVGEPVRAPLLGEHDGEPRFRKGGA
jgi:crotonobetainyl-CoA:carnitine CoA-transferase CaiB-like acyl-CoA transferase